MLVLYDTVLVRGPDGSVIRDDRRGPPVTYAREGHTIVAIEVETGAVVSSDGATIWLWEHGLLHGGVDVRHVVDRVQTHPTDALPVIERLAIDAHSTDPPGRAVFLRPLRADPARRRPTPSPWGHLPTVVFSMGSRELIAIQLGFFEEAHSTEPRYRSVVRAPNSHDGTAERRTLAWSVVEHTVFCAVMEVDGDQLALGQPTAVEVALDDTKPCRHIVPNVRASDVNAAYLVRPDGPVDWRAVIARGQSVATFELGRSGVAPRSAVATSPEESLVGADAWARPLVRSGDAIVAISANGARSTVASRVGTEVGVSHDGWTVAHRHTGSERFEWIDIPDP